MSLHSWRPAGTRDNQVRPLLSPESPAWWFSLGGTLSSYKLCPIPWTRISGSQLCLHFWRPASTWTTRYDPTPEPLPARSPWEIPYSGKQHPTFYFPAHNTACISPGLPALEKNQIKPLPSIPYLPSLPKACPTAISCTLYPELHFPAHSMACWHQGQSSKTPPLALATKSS